MTSLKPILAVCAAFALAACANPGRFDDAASAVDTDATAPLTTPAEVARNTPSYFTSSVGDRVLFLVDESTLTPEARQTLTGQAAWLNENAGFSVLIEGHADEQGTREHNLALGARRASAVQQFLISQGVAPDRLRTVTYGKERPIEICSEETCYAKNRRAVSVLSAGTS